MICERAHAKINISLDVLRKLENGYHELLMVMQSLELCDDVTISSRPGSGVISVKSDRAYLPGGEKNIAGKAARVFLDRMGIKNADIAVTLKKRIPVCAGLGGGSSDGAAVLRGLNRLMKTGCTVTELERMGEAVGSDVPYCVAGGTKLVGGRGERISPLPEMPKCHVVLAKPDFSVSTPELFGRIDCRKIRCRPDTPGIGAALERGDLRGVAMRAFNVFEEVIGHGSREIDDIKNRMYDFGALGASMSGTGSAVFGLFDGKDRACKAWEALKTDYKECFLTEISDEIIV